MVVLDHRMGSYLMLVRGYPRLRIALNFPTITITPETASDHRVKHVPDNM
jgi:hypothetical protein